MDIINEVLNGILEGLNIDGYLQDAYNYVVNMSPLPKAIGLLGFGIVTFMGLWQLIKTLSKFIIVVAIIAALYFLFDSQILDGIIG